MRITISFKISDEQDQKEDGKKEYDKKECAKQMKGQISFAEYLVAIVIFLSFVGYFSFQLLNFFPAYLTQVRNERVRSESYQLSELLINNPGYPIDWQSRIPSDVGSIKRLGLNDETQNVTDLVSTSKVNQFITLCRTYGYSKVKSLLDTDGDFSVIISIINSDSGTTSDILKCIALTPTSRAINTTIVRFAAINSSYYLQMILQVV